MIEQKSKSPLALMEQVIMILVFAFAAALCVRAFVMANVMSEKAFARDKAVNVSQTIAETVKAKKGNLEEAAELLGAETGENSILEGNGFCIYYNEEWESCTEKEADYTAEFVVLEKTAYLNKGKVSVKERNGAEEIFSLPVNWQEVADYE